MRSTLLLVTITLVLYGCISVSVNSRPEGVPATAVWAGGDKGGAWIDCGRVDQPGQVAYACTTYNDHTGHVWGSGNYLLAEFSTGNTYALVPTAPAELAFNFYNGAVIGLLPEGVLIADGWIDYPLGDGHGQRVLYRLGVEERIEKY